MLIFIVNIINAFLPLSLITGIIAALRSSGRAGKERLPIAFAVAGGFSAGTVIFFAAQAREMLTEAQTAVYATAILSFLSFAAVFSIFGGKNRKIKGLRWGTAILFLNLSTAAAVLSFMKSLTGRPLSTAGVLNTELVLNMSGIFFAIFLMLLIMSVSYHMARALAEGTAAAAIMTISLLAALPWSSELLLGLMRLEILELTGPRLSFVAKVTKYSFLLPYVHLLIVAATALLFLEGKKSAWSKEPESPEKAHRRKARSLVIHEIRWLKAALGAVLTVFASLLYYDASASKPPQISPPLKVAADGDGNVRIKIDEVRDGDLHRFAYETAGRQAIRFFLINRTPGGTADIGVVYDACMLCGNRGYIRRKNETICLACNVRLFAPSIGKAGGCNPIPLKHRVVAGGIIIGKEDLEQGVRYFPETGTNGK